MPSPVSRSLSFALALLGSTSCSLIACADAPEVSESALTESSSPPAVVPFSPRASASPGATLVPLARAEMDMYERELPRLMPPRSSKVLQGTSTPGEYEHLEVSGAEHVMLARRTVDGRIVQGCVSERESAVAFLEAPAISSAGETE
jgi:hypothetical protein